MEKFVYYSMRLIAKKSRLCKIGRGTQQGDPISPQLFNAVLEGLFRALKRKWEGNKCEYKKGRFSEVCVATGADAGADLTLAYTHFTSYDKIAGKSLWVPLSGSRAPCARSCHSCEGTSSGSRLVRISRANCSRSRKIAA